MPQAQFLDIPNWGTALGQFGSGVLEGYQEGREQDELSQLMDDVKGLEPQDAIREVFSRKNIPFEQKKAIADTYKQKNPIGGISGISIPEDISLKINEVISQNPEADSDELALRMDAARVPRAYSNQYIENRRRKEEAQTKTKAENEKERRKETLPTRQKIAEKAEESRESMASKEKLISLIDSNNLDDPTFAAFALSLPNRYGERLLSPETVEYRSGLLDQFKDLRQTFQGQTRTAEIKIMEDKIAGIYLTDDQKKAILKSRIDADKANIIREEAAAEVEEKYPNLGVIQFNKKVNQVAKPKLRALLDQVLDKQKAVIKEAENRKKLPLNPKDPDDVVILKQILKEAGGDKQKARRIAEEKGYKY